MKKIKAVVLSIFFFLAVSIAEAQVGTDADEKVQMAEGMRASGKIYVVVAVVLVVLAGLFIYVVQLDRKLRRLEKEHRS